MVAYPLPAAAVLAAPVTVTGVAVKQTVLSDAVSGFGAGQIWEVNAHGRLTTAVVTDSYEIELDLDGSSVFNWGVQVANSGALITNGEWNAWMKVMFGSATSFTVWGWDGFNFFFSSQNDVTPGTAAAGPHTLSLGITPNNAAASITVDGAALQRTA